MKYFTSEQVSCGHPDKICDQISDALLDAYLQADKNSRVAIETLIKNDTIVVAGEVTSNTEIDVCKTAEAVLNDIGLTGVYKVINLIDKQSTDIAMGVDNGGAGDQGIMFGYACNETPEELPLAYVLATKVLLKVRELNHKILKADAKSQVTVRYEDDNSIKIDTFLVSVQHDERFSIEDVKSVVEPIMKSVAEEYGMNTDFKVLVNPTGRFVIGGSYGDCGVTGRKIIADTYGGYARHGGGAFSGKDPTKVDRSAAYMARYLARYVLGKTHANNVEIQLGYAIGVAEPVSISVLVNGVENEKIGAYLQKAFDLTPNGIIEFLDLKNACYYDTAKYGHFTNKKYKWEGETKE